MVAGNQFTSSEHALQVAARAIESVHQSCDTIQNNVTNSKMSLAGAGRATRRTVSAARWRPGRPSSSR